MCTSLLLKLIERIAYAKAVILARQRSIITRWGEINNPTHDQHNISKTTIVLIGLLLLMRPVINEHIKIPKLNDKVSRNIFLLLLKLIYCRYIYCILFIWQGSFSFSIISVCLALKDLVSICFFFNYRKYPQSFRKWFIDLYSQEVNTSEITIC